MQLEQWLRAVLASKAAEIEPAPDMWERVKTGITAPGQERRIIMLGKVAAVALCGLLLAGGLTFGVSPQARAWATEKIQAIAAYKIIRTDAGYAVIKEEVASMRITAIEKQEVKAAKPVDNNLTPMEAEAAAGFPVSLPAYLPDGYEQVGISADKWDNGKGIVQVLYRTPDQQHPGLNLMLTDDQRFLKGGDAIKEVKMGNKTAYWSEFPVVNVGDRNAEPAVKAGHMLKWEDNGIVYMLRDNSSELSMDEMFRIAASIK